jgi:putative restriction endonuclease
VLQNDGVWVVHASGPLTPRQGSTDAKKSDLLAKDAAGGFSPEVQAALRSDPALVSEIAARLLENHFPESIHADIPAAVGLTLGVDKAAAKKRDPRFRQRVLTAYEYRCAVCGFDTRVYRVAHPEAGAGVIDRGGGQGELAHQQPPGTGSAGC